jgi:hypothetical protein
MENEDQEFWKALLTDRSLRTRFIRDLEIQSIGSRSAEDLAVRHHEEELLPRGGGASGYRAASSRSW